MNLKQPGWWSLCGPNRLWLSVGWLELWPERENERAQCKDEPE